MRRSSRECALSWSNRTDSVLQFVLVIKARVEFFSWMNKEAGGWWLRQEEESTLPHCGQNVGVVGQPFAPTLDHLSAWVTSARPRISFQKIFTAVSTELCIFVSLLFCNFMHPFCLGVNCPERWMSLNSVTLLILSISHFSISHIINLPRYD